MCIEHMLIRPVIPAQGVAGNLAGMPATCGTIGACLRWCALQAEIQPHLLSLSEMEIVS